MSQKSHTVRYSSGDKRSISTPKLVYKMLVLGASKQVAGPRRPGVAGRAQRPVRFVGDFFRGLRKLVTYFLFNTQKWKLFAGWVVLNIALAYVAAATGWPLAILQYTLFFGGAIYSFVLWKRGKQTGPSSYQWQRGKQQ